MHGVRSDIAGQAFISQRITHKKLVFTVSVTSTGEWLEIWGSERKETKYVPNYHFNLKNLRDATCFVQWTD
jgi:hypothetical protein